MSSPLSTEDHASATPDQPETVPATAPTEKEETRDEPAATTQTTGESALPSSTQFAFDETLFGSAPLGAAVEAGDDNNNDDDDVPYPEIDEASLLPPPDFRPFFTLIEDSTTGEHHHPTVHYLFADDDQDILTAAALETVSDEQQESADERFVIVDISTDGKDVVSVSSLSPHWQDLKTKVTQAPSWGDDSKTGDKGLMLRISGQEAESGGDDRRRKGDVDVLLKAFDDLAGSLEGVLGSTTSNEDTQIAQ